MDGVHVEADVTSVTTNITIDTIIDSFVGNCEFVLSPEFWNEISKDQRGRLRACLKLSHEKMQRLDRLEKEVRKMLQEK